MPKMKVIHSNNTVYSINIQYTYIVKLQIHTKIKIKLKKNESATLYKNNELTVHLWVNEEKNTV